MNKKKRIILITILGIIFLVLIVALCSNGRTTEMEYAKFHEYLEDGAVEKVMIGEGSITFEISGDDTRYSTDNPKVDSFKEKLLLKGVQVEEEMISEDNLIFVMDIFFYLLFFVAVIGIFNKVRESFSGNFKLIKNTGVSFDDIAGMEKEKKELLYVVQYLKNPQIYKSKGIRPIKGIILEGPPGNGKTLFARALANECDVNFIATKGADFQSALMAMGPAKVNSLFNKAKKHKPCIIFIDEFDGIGEARNYTGTGIDKENNRMIITMLNALDGFENDNGIVVIAATNSYESLDKALIRPGRFDLKYHIGNPDEKTIIELIKIYTKDKELSKDISMDKLVSLFNGCSCARIEAVLNQASIYAMTDSKKGIDMECLKKAISS